MTRWVKSSAILSSTIIGAGIFSLPYVFKTTGIYLGAFYLIVGVLVITLIHLFYAEILLSSDKKEGFVGYVKEYLNKPLSYLSFFNSVVAVIVDMTIFLLLSGSFLKLLNIDNSIGVMVFWLAGSWVFFWKMKSISRAEILGFFGIVLTIIIIALYAISKHSLLLPNPSRLNLETFLFPLAPILFSLYGRTGIPIVLKNEESNLNKADSKKSIILGTILPGIIYLTFIISVFGITPTPSPDTIGGLTQILPSPLLIIIGILGIVALWTTYITFELDVRKIITWDFKIPSSISTGIVIITPLILWLMGIRNFIQLVSISGGILLPVEAIIISLIALKISSHKNSLFFSKKYLLLSVSFVVILMTIVAFFELWNILYILSAHF